MSVKVNWEELMRQLWTLWGPLRSGNSGGIQVDF